MQIPSAHCRRLSHSHFFEKFLDVRFDVIGSATGIVIPAVKVLSHYFKLVNHYGAFLEKIMLSSAFE